MKRTFGAFFLFCLLALVPQEQVLGAPGDYEITGIIITTNEVGTAVVEVGFLYGEATAVRLRRTSNIADSSFQPLTPGIITRVHFDEPGKVVWVLNLEALLAVTGTGANFFHVVCTVPDE